MPMPKPWKCSFGRARSDRDQHQRPCEDDTASIHTEATDAKREHNALSDVSEQVQAQ